MAEKVEIKFYKIDNITQATTKNSLFAVKSDNENSFKLYVTDLDGNLIPLFTSSGTGGGITNLTSTDSSILITGSAVKDLKLSTTLKNLINSALQSGDFISNLVNDSGYLTLADLPTFNPSDYDLEDFTNNGTDPFVKQSELSSGGATNLAYTPSPTNGTITSDTGSDATIPLADNTNAGLINSAEKSKIATAIQPSDLGVVATSNDYTDLDNIPTTFTPSAHTHVEADITDLDKYTQLEVDNFLNNKVDKVLGKGLSTEDYTSTEKSKLAGIEAGAEINVNADWNATSGDAQILNKPIIPSIAGLATETYVDSKISNTITNGVTNKAPNEDTVFGALATKQDILTDVNFGAFANGLTAKTTVVDADSISIVDSADSNKSKKTSWLNVWTNYIKPKVDSLLATFKTANFLDFTSSGQTQLDNKVDKTNWIDISLTSTIVGFSSFTTRIIRYKQISDNVIWVKGSLVGISNSPLLNCTIPFTSTNNNTNYGIAGIVNNTIQPTPGFATCNANSNVIRIFKDNSASAFASSGNKTGIFSILIEVQ